MGRFTRLGPEAKLRGGMPFLHDYAGLPFPDAVAISAEHRSALVGMIDAGGFERAMKTGSPELKKGLEDMRRDGCGALIGLTDALMASPSQGTFTARFAVGVARATQPRWANGAVSLVDMAALDSELGQMHGFASMFSGEKSQAAESLADMWIDMNGTAMPASPNGKLPEKAAAQYVVMDKACELMGYALSLDPTDSARMEAMLSGREAMDREFFKDTLEKSMTEYDYKVLEGPDVEDTIQARNEAKEQERLAEERRREARSREESVRSLTAYERMRRQLEERDREAAPDGCDGPEL